MVMKEYLICLNSQSKLKVNGVDGYKVYRATSKTGTYTYLGTISPEGEVLQYNDTTTKGKTYYYKVRAYIIVDGQKVHTPYSSIKSITSK